MKATKTQPAARRAPAASRPAAPKPGELAELRARLAEADETLRAIRGGEVDAVMGTGKQGEQVFTLPGAEHAYRVLIESMNEGALTLTSDKTILYANECFARMVKCPLEKVTGGSFRRFLSTADRASLRALLKRATKIGSKIQVMLEVSDGTKMSAQISVRPLEKNDFAQATFGMVVTDLTEARRTEELLRALANRTVQVQEAERGSVAVDLHDHITQLLCAILFRCQALVVELSAEGGPSMREAVKLRAMLGHTAQEVERISRNLRPGVLDQLGLVAVLRATGTEFADRTGVGVKLTFAELGVRLPADTELALYRILQEALKNVEKHAHARRVTVKLVKQGDLVQLTVRDDGDGFDAAHHAASQKRKGVLGLLSMSERASFVGGTLTVKSAPHSGTEIEVRIPLALGAIAAN